MGSDDDKDVDENGSDVEMEGVDLEAEDEEEPEEELTTDEHDGTEKEFAEREQKTEEEISVLEHMDSEELEEARKERMELMAAEKEKVKPAKSSTNSQATHPAPMTAQERLDYLIAQSDVFAHFLAGSVAASAKKGKRGGSRGKSGRLTEAEEDAQLLRSAQSKRRVVRVEAQPSNLSPHCKMHPYQLEGLNWLIKLHDNGINGILADEMGLGKTLQTIAFLAYLRESRGVRGPHLIIVPKSVVGNWMRELAKWCPCIVGIRMGGTKDERAKVVNEHLKPDPATGKHRFDVLVTSYEGFLKEKYKLGKISWRYLIIDEAHRIKNEASSLSVAVRNTNTAFRLLITGTPLQNNLRELWALLNFLMPDIFGDADQFDEWFNLSDESGKENVVKKLHTVLRPFMLRRVKSDVATALPPKKETKLYVGLTKMQHEWYIHCLQKDAHELNKLGGPDRNRLLNVLMQLRKVCNHPYLFEGAEVGPPYVDGPHLWENSGKMQLIHKLLPKLKEKSSRVLIFSTMTRVLDILEDYFRLLGYEYCRLDGNTEGERRDAQVDEFNQPGSTKFAFLLSTRAGGLGINLATADIVILYDSDFNPQVDLQAQDRAHRIGQTKPVQVFRLISEGTVEEKIIERAERKLFLDAAVIQQGRLAEQHASLELSELMKMVKFGADQILNGKGGTYTDEDIDALIARGEAKTSEMQAKLQTDAQHNLANFSLLADDDTGKRDTFSYEGKNYRDSEKDTGNFINLPQRQRKRLYDVSAAAGGGAASGTAKPAPNEASTKKKRKGPVLHDFQLFDRERLNAILEKERGLATQQESLIQQLAEMRNRIADSSHGPSRVALQQRAEEMEKKVKTLTLTAEEEKEKASLYREGFPDWNRKDFKAFCAALERHGRYDFAAISRDVAQETGKARKEIQRYFVAFWTNYERILEWQKIIDRIERGEKKILRLRQIRDAIQEKVERHLEEIFGPSISKLQAEGTQLPSVADMLQHSWQRMKINYGGGNRGKGYQEEEDAFLLCQMYRHGYGAAERIRMEIRRAWQFRFDWYFKSRSALEIHKRCELLVKIIERENEEVRKSLQGKPKEADTEGAKPAAKVD